MAMGKLAVIAVALGVAIGGLAAAATDWTPLGGDDSVALATDDARKDDLVDDVAGADGEGDGDRTRGDDGTGGGNNTGDGDRTRENDGTRAGDNAGDGDWTVGDDGTAGGDNTRARAPAPAPAPDGGGGDDASHRGGSTD